MYHVETNYIVIRTCCSSCIPKIQNLKKTKRRSNPQNAQCPPEEIIFLKYQRFDLEYVLVTQNAGISERLNISKVKLEYYI